MITFGKLQRAMEETERFRNVAYLAMEKIRDAQNCPPGKEPALIACLISGSKETGAVRRASLDLTRALAELRRGW